MLSHYERATTGGGPFEHRLEGISLSSRYGEIIGVKIDQFLGKCLNMLHKNVMSARVRTISDNT